jgi:preprotein translocase subunit YajC
MFYTLILWAEENAQEPAPIGGLGAFLPMILIILAFVFLVFLPQRRQEKRQRALLYNSLKKNDEVVTNSGIIGIVANIKDDEVTLKIDESSNARIRVLRSCIAQIRTPKDSKEAEVKAS